MDWGIVASVVVALALFVLGMMAIGALAFGAMALTMKKKIHATEMCKSAMACCGMDEKNPSAQT